MLLLFTLLLFTLSDKEIRDIYKGLWKIEETFKITKTELETRPIFVWTDESIEAYFLEGFKGSELNDYLFYIITKILIHLNNVQITKKEDDYQALLSSYNAKLVLKKCYRSQK